MDDSTFEDECVELQRLAHRKYLYDPVFHLRVAKARRILIELRGGQVSRDEQWAIMLATYIADITNDDPLALPG